MSVDLQSLEKIPRHVALIMDGNGRWARERGLDRIEGHKEGAQSVRAVLRAAAQAGIEFITVYAFSTENWKRPPQEVDGLMKLLVGSLDAYEQELHDNKIRLRVMGQFERLPLPVRRRLQKTIDATRDYTGHTFVIALSYGARTEIADAARKIAEKVQAGELAPGQIDEQTVADHLYLPDVPDPELMIRTSGELRLSNFLLWQLSYSEFHITEKHWRLSTAGIGGMVV
jgi:undecaprenyl diphosphate synthase